MTKTDDNRIFVDTNVLLAATDTSREKHADAIAFLNEGLKGTYRLFVISQIFREYLVVATRPVNANGLGLSPSDAGDNVRRFQCFVETLAEDGDTTDRLLRLARTHKITGKRIHDANLVASMERHGLHTLKTFNPGDFEGISDVEIL